eukprot:scaffold2460_cov109-Isochrysis_galbana.AAC.7
MPAATHTAPAAARAKPVAASARPVAIKALARNGGAVPRGAFMGKAQNFRPGSWAARTQNREESTRVAEGATTAPPTPAGGALVLPPRHHERAHVDNLGAVSGTSSAPARSFRRCLRARRVGRTLARGADPSVAVGLAAFVSRPTRSGATLVKVPPAYRPAWAASLARRGVLPGG